MNIDIRRRVSFKNGTIKIQGRNLNRVYHFHANFVADNDTGNFANTAVCHTVKAGGKRRDNVTVT